MTLHTAMVLLRRAVFCVAPGVALVALGASGNAFAQSAEEHAAPGAATAFSSSMDGTAPAAPEPVAAGKPAVTGQDNSYGGHYHRRGWGSRLAFEAGGGANGPTGDSSDYITWGGNLTVGAGYKFNPHFSALVEYQFIDDKLPGRLIAETGATGGNAHIWSFTVAPVVDLFPRRTNDIYITGGGGFYRKVTNFTDPQESYYCDYFYGYCGVDVENVVVGHFSSNQGGWNIGAGFTHRLGGIYGDSNVKLFAEARYLDILTPAVQGITPNGLGVTTVGADTKLVPITLGVRF